VAQAEGAAGDGVGERDLGRAVVSHQALHTDAVGVVEAQRAAKEADRGGGLLVGEDLNVGQAGGIVDADVHVLPADLALCALGVGVLVAGDAVSGAALDAPELLDVDVDQLAGMAALVAVGRLGRLKPRELAQRDAGVGAGRSG
jgi:hypothetical protein